MSPQITVLYFAAASTCTGLFEQTITLPTTSTTGTSISDNGSAPGEPVSKSKPNFPLAALAALLVSLHPNTGLDKVLEVSQWSVNAEMVPKSDVDSLRLYGGEEVAVICPVSGG